MSSRSRNNRACQPVVFAQAVRDPASDRRNGRHHALAVLNQCFRNALLCCDGVGMLEAAEARRKLERREEGSGAFFAGCPCPHNARGGDTQSLFTLRLCPPFNCSCNPHFLLLLLLLLLYCHISQISVCFRRRRRRRKTRESGVKMTTRAIAMTTGVEETAGTVHGDRTPDVPTLRSSAETALAAAGAEAAAVAGRTRPVEEQAG